MITLFIVTSHNNVIKYEHEPGYVQFDKNIKVPKYFMNQ